VLKFATELCLVYYISNYINFIHSELWKTVCDEWFASKFSLYVCAYVRARNEFKSRRLKSNMWYKMPCQIALQFIIGVWVWERKLPPIPHTVKLRKHISLLFLARKTGLQKAWRHFLKVKLCRDSDFSDAFPVQMCRFCRYLVVLCNPYSLEQIDYTIFNPLSIYLFIVQFVGLNTVYNCPNDVFTNWDSGLKWVNIYYINICKEPTRCNLAVCLLVTAILLYMFRTLFASILRST